MGEFKKRLLLSVSFLMLPLPTLTETEDKSTFSRWLDVERKWFPAGFAARDVEDAGEGLSISLFSPRSKLDNVLLSFFLHPPPPGENAALAAYRRVVMREQNSRGGKEKRTKTRGPNELEQGRLDPNYTQGAAL